jgi:hypothetical protein
MGKKLILTEQQHSLIVNEILKETVEKIELLEREGSINEGFWDTVKHGLSKLGRYKVDGKFGGRMKTDQGAARKIQQIVDKQGNEMIRKLDATIRKQNPDFPNNKDPKLFLSTIMSIASVYDSIVASTQKGPEEEGYLPVDAANGIINDLRDYVKKFLDVDLTAVYSVTNEGEELNEEETASDVRTNLQAKRGGGDDFESSRMNTLKSNRLPLTLAGIGASLGAFSWLVNTDWFKSLFDEVTNVQSIEQVKQVVQDKSSVFADINPGEGMTQIMNRLNGLNLNPNSTPQDFLNGVKQLGGGDLNAGIDALSASGGIFKNPEAAKQVLEAIAQNPNGYGSNLGEVFQGQWAGTGKQVGDLLVTQTGGSLQGIIIKTIVTAVPKVVTKTAIKTGAGYAAAKGLGGVLGPIGIGLLATGALVKLMRMKGQKSSRAATLNALYQSIRNIEGGVGVIEPQSDVVAPEVAGTEDALVGSTNNMGNDNQQQGQSGDKTSSLDKTKDNVYNNLKSLFQFIVNNKNTMGTKSQYGVGTAPAPMNEAKYITDKRVIQYLSKSLPFDKLKNFENLLNRVELLRNSLRKLGTNTGDKNLDNFLRQLEANPIMLTNFTELLKVNPTNPQDVNSLLGFIKEVLLGVYTGDYKFGNMVGKMSTLGGGNINKVTEEDIDEASGYSSSDPNKSFNKDAQSRKAFKGNLIKFLSIAMNIFQYLHKTRGGQIARKDTENKYTAPQRTEPKKQAEPVKTTAKAKTTPKNQTQMELKEDVILAEEINRIKKIMLS